MKFQVLGLVLVVAGGCAMTPASDVAVVDSPNQPAPRIIIDDIIREIIHLISDGIKKIGLDPLEIEKIEFVFPPKSFPVNVAAHIENLKFDGASNIKIDSLDYSILFSKLSFNISHPQLSYSVGDSGIEVSFFNHKFDSHLKGSLIIESIGLSGEVSLSLGVIHHFNLRSISLNFFVGNIKSDLTVSAFGFDFSKFLNNLLNVIVPYVLKVFGGFINVLLEGIVRGIFFLINLII